MSKKVFTEEQRFTQWWLWVLLIASLAGMTAAFISDYEPTTEYLLSMTSGYGILLLVILLLANLKLKSRIDENGIQLNFWPFIRNKHIEWQALEKAEVVKYSPLQDYGGWGYRFTFGSKGKAVNVKGNMGIKLYFKSGKPFLIGTQKAEEARAVLSQYQTKKETF
ncbi:MAG: hypothetical protein RIC95_11940 [Vicingaceae bacterium]